MSLKYKFFCALFFLYTPLCRGITMSSQKKFITLGFTGDVMLGRLTNEALKKHAPAYIWGDALGDVRSTDLNIINLENSKTIIKRNSFEVPITPSKFYLSLLK